MLPLAVLQLFPASLLLFIATAPTATLAFDNPWPSGLGPLSKITSGLESWTRKDGTTTTHQIFQPPITIRKMSGDKSEMFFPEYWQFESGNNRASKLELDGREPTLRNLEPVEDERNVKDWANASIPQPLQAPFSLHTTRQLDKRPLLSRLLRSPEAIFARDTRDFSCPGGTSSCASINRPNSCCASGLVCQLTTDSGLGDVGCCQTGQVCGQQVSGCPSQDLTCPDSLGGGCCIPGSVCAGVGCELYTRSPSFAHESNV